MNICGKCKELKEDKEFTRPADKAYCKECCDKLREERERVNKIERVCKRCEMFYYNKIEQDFDRYLATAYCPACINSHHEDCRNEWNRLKFKNGCFDPTDAYVRSILIKSGVNRDDLKDGSDIIMLEKRKIAMSRFMKWYSKSNQNK